MREGTVEGSGGFRILALVAAAALALLGAGEALAGTAGDEGPDTVGCFDPSFAGATAGPWYFSVANTPSVMTVFTPWLVYGSTSTSQIPVAGEFGGGNVDGIAIYTDDGTTALWTAAADVAAVDLNFALTPTNYYELPINNTAAATTRPIPLAGNFVGPGNPGVALYYPDAGQWVIDTNPGSPTQIAPMLFGPVDAANVVPLVGDWDGDGIDTVGKYIKSSSVFYITNDITNATEANKPAKFKYFKFGEASNGFIPIVGDWDLQGGDSIGLFDPTTGTVRLRNTNTPGPSDVMATLTTVSGTCVPVAGNWGLALP